MLDIILNIVIFVVMSLIIDAVASDSNNSNINDETPSTTFKNVNPSLLRGGKLIFDELKRYPFSTYKIIDLSLRSNRNSYTIKNSVNNEVQVELDDTYAKVDHVPGLKTTLYPHQKNAVHGMLEMENVRKFNVIRSEYDRSDTTISYNAAVLSEPVGSGKTIDILALILLSPVPRALPDIMTLKTTHSTKSVGFIKCRFKRLLTPTLIFVGASVMTQWEDAIGQFTDLRVFSIKSIKELRVLFNMMESNTLNANFDVVLVKNGQITRPIRLPNGIELHSKNTTGSSKIYNLIDNCGIYCWARVVVDDFDTIGLPPNAGIVRGVFTWYVSSTRKSMSTRQIQTHDTQTASDCLRKYSFGCNNIMYNHLLFRALNIRNKTEYIKKAVQMPRPKYHVCLYENPNNRLLSLMNSMGDSEVNRITEMLNGDAIKEAAEAAGVASSSVSDIFSTLLGSKFSEYKLSGDIIEFIEYEQSDERVDGRMPMDEHEDPDARYNKSDLLEYKEIEYKYPGVNSLLKDNHKSYTELRNQSGLAIERVKSNIAHGQCPVCRIDLSDSNDTVIVKCCNAVFCGICGFKAQGLGDRYNKLSNGHCANCRQRLSIKDLIYIGKDSFGLDDILEENFEYTENDDEKDDPLETANRTKYTAVIDIIKGSRVKEDKRVDLHIPNMMKGDKSLPEPTTRKVLIFANFEETLEKIIEELTKNNIKYWKLQGGIGEIAHTSKTFTMCTETCAMVINSTRHCSGLNLQTATDLIFAHKMISQAVESQVAGRGHRLGRMSPLNIWYLMYDNEYEELKITHNVRELTTSEITHEENLEKGIEQSTLNVVDNANIVLDGTSSNTKKSSDTEEDDCGSDEK